MHTAWSEYLDLLNTEADEGDVAAAALLNSTARDALLAEHPEWLRVGTMNALLRAVHTAMSQNLDRAEELVAFVMRHLDQVPAPSGAPILLDRLQGTAWKDRGNVYYRQGKNKDALAAAQQAIAIFSRRPALVVHRASALFLQAQVWHALSQTAAALDLLAECQATFGEHGDTRHWVQALVMRAVCFFDLGEQHPDRPDYYAQARTIGLEAEREARQLGDEVDLARVYNNLGYCNLVLGDITAAQRYFGKAFTGFHAQRMDGEVQRTVAGIALVAREHGQTQEALDMLHGVYREFLDRGMPTAAAGVLVEILDTVTQVTGDVTFAARECDRLSASLGTYDLPTSVQAAVAYVQEQAQMAETPTILLRGLAHARAFFTDYSDQPETRFVPPA